VGPQSSAVEAVLRCGRRASCSTLPLDPGGLNHPRVDAARRGSPSTRSSSANVQKRAARLALGPSEAFSSGDRERIARVDRVEPVSAANADVRPASRIARRPISPAGSRTRAFRLPVSRKEFPPRVRRPLHVSTRRAWLAASRPLGRATRGARRAVTAFVLDDTPSALLSPRPVRLQHRPVALGQDDDVTASSGATRRLDSRRRPRRPACRWDATFDAARSSRRRSFPPAPASTNHARFATKIRAPCKPDLLAHRECDRRPRERDASAPCSVESVPRLLQLRFDWRFFTFMRSQVRLFARWRSWRQLRRAESSGMSREEESVLGRFRCRRPSGCPSEAPRLQFGIGDDRLPRPGNLGL